MSLLADLLSKKNIGDDLPDGNEIPPTLAMAQVPPAKVTVPNRRYVVLVAACAALVVVGIVAVTQYGRLVTLITGKPVVAAKPAEPPKVAAPVAPPTAVVPPPVDPVTPAADPLKTAAAEQAAKPVQASGEDAAKKNAEVKVEKKKSPAGAVRRRQRAQTGPVAEKSSSAKVDTALRDSFLYVARSAEAGGDWRLALANYRKALKVDPENFRIMNNVAAALNNLGMFDEGAREAKRALGRKPDYVPAMINAAIAYSSSGNSLEALLLFSNAVSADPTNRSLVINLGILQERTGKLEDAKKTYRQLAEMGDPQAIHGMARVNERTGNRVEAIRFYRQILANPSVNQSVKKEAKERVTRLEEQ